MSKPSLFERIGGRPTLDRVHKIFYDRLYAHPWLGGFFAGVEQTHIEKQQSDFMSGAMGGPEAYAGRRPQDAHPHLFITEELFELRHQILEESMIEAGVPEDLRKEWLKIDGAFKRAIVKGSPAECSGRFPTEQVIAIPKPKSAA